jgi:predicted nuclease of restriction endonuclease-like (RecB) superfamily
MNLDNDYKIWITSLKDKIRNAQIKASIAVNEQMIMLYLEIGKSIIQKQSEQKWGGKIVEQLAKDLKSELTETNGFSRTNLFEMRKFYLFYKDTEFVHQVGGQITEQNLLYKIPWRHHVAIIGKCKTTEEAKFYIEQTIQNNWSRNVLEIQLGTKLINRLGKAQNNFELTLPKPQSDLAKETLKDPYKFDFLTIESDVQELELEKHLTDNITKFLLVKKSNL